MSEKISRYTVRALFITAAFINGVALGVMSCIVEDIVTNS